MVVKDDKGNEKHKPMHGNKAPDKNFSLTVSSAWAVPSQHGPVLNTLQTNAHFR